MGKARTEASHENTWFKKLTVEQLNGLLAAVGEPAFSTQEAAIHRLNAHPLASSYAQEVSQIIVCHSISG